MLPPIMFSVPIPSHLLRRVSLFALITAAFGLAACANVPKASVDTPVAAEALASAASLRGEAGNWPAQDWWKGFNDPQLNALMAEGLANAPDIKAAAARMKKADAMFDQIKAGLEPTLTLNTSVVEAKQSLNTGFPPAFKSFLPSGYLPQARATLDANYDIDLWGKSRAALRGTLGQAQATALEAQVTKQALTASIARAYVELDRLYQERDDIAEIHHGADIRVELVQARLDHNIDDMDTLLSAKDDQAKVAQRLSAIDGAIHIQSNLIAALIGASPDRGLSLTRPKLTPAGVDTLPDDVRANLLGRRPDVQAARLRVEAAGHQIKYYKADFYPNVKLNASWGVQAIGLQYLGQPDSQIGSIGPAVSLPIFKGGQLRAQYRSAEADYNTAVAAYDQALVQAMQQVADAAAGTRSTVAQLKQTQTRVTSAQTTYDLSKARYAKGIGTKVDVLAAHSALIAAELDESNIMAQAYNDRISFIAALGGGFQTQ